jgi:hypothetical protein
MKRSLSLFILTSLVLASFIRPSMAGKKVLYFTHEPGRWHKYTTQKKIFEQIAKKADWEVTVMSGEHEAQIKKLRTPDFGKGYDAIVYNFCFAKSRDLEAQANLVAQTREHGVPALLIHCAMHSWWPSYKDGKPGAIGPDYKGKAKGDPKLVAEWRKKHGKKPFPAWGDFTGVASGRHGPKQPIVMQRVGDHAATKSISKGYTTGNTELYNNIYVLDEVVPLIEGKQGNAKAIVMWLCPQGKSQVMGLTVGHDVGDWATDEFRSLITDGVNYLIANPKP